MVKIGRIAEGYLGRRHEACADGCFFHLSEPRILKPLLY